MCKKIIRCVCLTLVLLLLLTACAACEPTLSGEPVSSGEPAVSALDSAQPAEPGDSPSPSPAPQRTLTFLFFSDTQPDPETMDFSGTGELVRQAVGLHDNAELMIFGGDTVDDGADETQWLAFHRAIGVSREGLISAAVAGNHDNHDLLVGQFDYPVEAPGGPGEGFFYSLRLGPVFFLMLDSNIMGAAKSTDIEWLQNELRSEAAREADWRVAVMHHPMWPASDIPKDIQRAEIMRAHFLPILEEYGVELILCGHQHMYSRTRPMRGESISNDGGGIVQVIAASGGKASYTIGERGFIAVSDMAPNYLLVEVATDSVAITAFDRAHNIIDQIVITGVVATPQ